MPSRQEAGRLEFVRRGPAGLAVYRDRTTGELMRIAHAPSADEPPAGDAGGSLQATGAGTAPEGSVPGAADGDAGPGPAPPDADERES